MPKKDDPPKEFASPPCFLHELGPEYLGLPAEDEPSQSKPAANKKKPKRSAKDSEKKSP